MQVEHVAWQVNDPLAVAQWYVKHLGFRVLRKLENSPYCRHLSESSSPRCMILALSRCFSRNAPIDEEYA